MVQELSTKQIFENMREWVKNSGVETYIRNTAVKVLQMDMPEEIGSSDIACEMVNLHQQWLRDSEHDPNLNLLVFLMEKCNNLR